MKLRLALLIIVGALMIMGCPTPPLPGGGATAKELTDDGIALMEAGDWEGALSKFSEATVLDPTYGEAVVGYSALNIASIMVAPDMVDLVHTNLGMDGYPATMNAVIDPEGWMLQLQAPYAGLMPHVSGEEAYDGVYSDFDPADGVIDPMERQIAFMGWFATHNVGFSAAAQKVINALGTRLDTAIASIKAVSDDATFALTWDMFMDVQPDESSWPFKDGVPMEIVIGKAEILAIASSLEAVKGFINLALVYNTTIPLGEYWDAFNPLDGDDSDPSQKPFDALLQLNADAAERLAAAKTAHLAALSDFDTSVTMVLADRAGFYLSSDAAAGGFADAASWDSFTLGLRIAQREAEEVSDSIQTSDVAYLPFYGTIDPDNWPTAASPETGVLGVNFGVFYNTPLNLLGCLFELSTGTDPVGEAAGEPVLYDLTGSTLAKVDSSYFPADNDFSDPHVVKLLYAKIQDITFGGLIPIENITLDDPSTQFFFDLGFNDYDFDNLWDPGESLYYVSFYAMTEGPLDPTNPGYGGDPVGYYDINGGVPDSYLASYTEAANYDALRAEIDTIMGTYHYLYSPSFLVGTSLYMTFADDCTAWNAFTAKGTAGVDTMDAPMTSTGSIWWSGGQSMYGY